MDLVKYLQETSFYSSWVVLPLHAVQQEFNKLPPFAEGKWDFRSVVVLVGIGCSLTVFVLASLGTTALVANLSLAVTAILCFSLYYVSRFAELTQMTELLGQLQGKIYRIETMLTGFEEHDQRSAETHRALEDRVGDVMRSLVSLTANLQQTSQIKEGLETQVNLLRGENQEFKAARDNFDSELGAKLRQLDEITARQTAAAAELASLNKSTEAIQGELHRLERVRDSLTSQIDRLIQTIDEASNLNVQNRQALADYHKKLLQFASPRKDPDQA